MNGPITDQEEARAQDLLNRARRLQVLAAALTYPEPGSGHVKAIGQDLAWLVAATDDAPVALTGLLAAWMACDEERLRAEHGRLFLGQTLCPLHAAAYGSARNLAGPAADLADISGFYQAFGMDLRIDMPERPDLLIVQLEFYASLLIREAYARVQGWQDALEIATDAARAFLQDHLGRWRGVLGEGLTRCEARAPLPELAAWLDLLLEAECEDRAVAPEPFGGPAREAVSADAFTCPHAGGA
ncbi:molecular chaperone TorD family protein [Thioalkalicoccus limnaeus]|uniref:Molecular chaperone TorD family protein n=1 Tax=Thioalkalicoccus limnaeus TaxID=120681 RepID=A0ABV4BIU9_9GAMM